MSVQRACSSHVFTCNHVSPEGMFACVYVKPSQSKGHVVHLHLCKTVSPKGMLFTCICVKLSPKGMLFTCISVKLSVQRAYSPISVRKSSLSKGLVVHLYLCETMLIQRHVVHLYLCEPLSIQRACSPAFVWTSVNPKGLFVSGVGKELAVQPTRSGCCCGARSELDADTVGLSRCRGKDMWPYCVGHGGPKTGIILGSKWPTNSSRPSAVRS